MRFSSIRWRLPISYAGIALLTAAVLGSILLLTLREYYQEQERTYLLNSAQLMSPGIADLLEDNPSPTELQIYLQNLSFLIQARIRLFDPEENVLADSGSLQTQQFIYTNLNPYGMNAEVLREGRAERYLFHVAINVLDGSPVAEGIGSNPVLLPQLPTENTLCGFGLGNQDTKSLQHTDQAVQLAITGSDDRFLGTLEISEGLAFGGKIIANVAEAWGLSGFVAIMVAAGAGFGVSQRLVSPLTDLTAVTRQMSSGDLSARAHVDRRDELGILGRSFNAMAERVEDLVETLRSFIADAAHELHTPLTTLRVNLDLVAEDDQNRPEYLTAAQIQLLRLQSLVDSLLDLSRIEAGKLNKMPLSLSQLVRECADKYATRAGHAEISFNSELSPEAIDICGDEVQIQRALDNLLDNALKFTPTGGSITLQLKANDQHACITVKDTGIGIPPEDLPHVFRRFHRGRNAAAYPGSGLGLAIAKAIIDRHGGDLKIESDLHGTSATILLPRSD